MRQKHTVGGLVTRDERACPVPCNSAVATVPELASQGWPRVLLPPGTTKPQCTLCITSATLRAYPATLQAPNCAANPGWRAHHSLWHPRQVLLHGLPGSSPTAPRSIVPCPPFPALRDVTCSSTHQPCAASCYILRCASVYHTVVSRLLVCCLRTVLQVPCVYTSSGIPGYGSRPRSVQQAAPSCFLLADSARPGQRALPCTSASVGAAALAMAHLLQLLVSCLSAALQHHTHITQHSCSVA